MEARGVDDDELRVVWATGEVMAIFSPMQALSSVDLPAFGRPTRATKPERKACSEALAVSEFMFFSLARLKAGRKAP